MRRCDTDPVPDTTPLRDRYLETPRSPSQSGPDGVVYSTPFFYARGQESEQTTSCHRYRFAVADHQMIEHPHANQLQGVAQFVSDRTVGRAGFGNTGGIFLRRV